MKRGKSRKSVVIARCANIECPKTEDRVLRLGEMISEHGLHETEQSLHGCSGRASDLHRLERTGRFHWSLWTDRWSQNEVDSVDRWNHFDTFVAYAESGQRWTIVRTIPVH